MDRFAATCVALTAIYSTFCFAQLRPSLNDLGQRVERELQTSAIVGSDNVAITNSSISINDPKVFIQAIGGALFDSLRSLSAGLRPPLPSGDEEIERIRQIEGTGTERKGAQKALRQYRLAAQRGNYPARVHAARLLFDLVDPVADDMAVRELEIASKRGVAEASAWLAWTHEVKRRKDHSEAEALRLYKEAARRGDAWAAFRLGVAYQRGRLGVARNEGLALKSYEEASRSYYAPAILEVAWIAAYGEKEHRDDDRARRLFELAAQLGESSAYFHLGDRYQTGTGMPQDVFRAAENFERAASLGHLSAQNSLAILLLGGSAIPRNIDKAVEWFRKAHVAGLIQASVNLGNRYRTGDGVAKDATEAFRLYLKAAEAGNNFSKLFVAEMYFAGEGTQKDVRKSIDWFKRALDDGMSNACVHLGQIYSEGLDVPKDFDEAAKWLRSGIKLGNEQCRNNQASMIALAKVKAADGEDFLEMYRLSAEAGHSAALNNYGLRLINGDGLSPNLERGTDMLLKAADLGVDSARLSVADLILKRVGRFGKPQPQVALKYLLGVSQPDRSVSNLLQHLSLVHGQALSKADRTTLVDTLEKSLRSNDPETSRGASIALGWIHLLIEKSKPNDPLLLLQRLYERNEAGDGDAGFVGLVLLVREFKPPDAEFPDFLKLAAETESRPGLMQPFTQALMATLRTGKFGNKELFESIVGAPGADEVMRDVATVELITSRGQSAAKYLREQAKAGVTHANFLLCRLFLDRKAVPLSAAEIEACRQSSP